MYARNLFRLFTLVGVSQADVARALGVSRQVVSSWALGLAPVPDNHLQTLGKLLDAATRKALSRKRSLREEWTNTDARRELSAQLLQCLDALREEQTQGGPLTLIQSASPVLQEYDALDPATRAERLQHAEHRQQYKTALAQALAGVIILDRLGPIETVILAHVKGRSNV